MSLKPILSTFLLFSTFLAHLWAVPTTEEKQELQKKADLKIKTFQVPEGMKVDLWADKTQTKNPAHFTFDSKGRMYIGEIDRWRFGVDDIRQRPYMLLDDILIESSEDRMAMFRKHLNKHSMEWYTAKSDRIRIVEDRDGDGRADLSRVYADNFNDPLDGPGMGLIERDGSIYYTNIPHLWKLDDTNGDGISDKRESIQDGFGIRMSFSGHDMHGLVWGPDGKLYWSIGDRGFSIKTKEGKVHHYPNEGAAFRCDPDGSNVELFCRGLRNPQELAFDNEGNLFTADNDGDNGDIERISYLVEGGDYGWHAGHQSIMSFRNKYPLRTYSHIKEKRMMTDWLLCDMSKAPTGKQPAYQIPGIGEINGGPSGFLFNSGLSMGEDYFEKFFVIHFKGSIARTYVSMFNIKDDGAGFKTYDHEDFFKGSNVVDLEFGPDGKMYFSEYNNGGWLNQDVGSIYTFYYPEKIAQPEIQEIKTILTSDFSKYSEEQLYHFLAVKDLRVRQRSQFELAKRGSKGVEVFIKAIKSHGVKHRRLHGIWGIGQMAYQNKALLNRLFPFVDDSDASVRTQIARVFGDHRFKAADDQQMAYLKDEHPRVAMYAAIGLGRTKCVRAFGELIHLLERNADKDTYVRHGAIMGITGIGSIDSLLASSIHPSDAVRMGVLLSMRRLQSSKISKFLYDNNPAIVAEAIRAINDVPIQGAQEALAMKLEDYGPGKTFEQPDNEIKELLHHRMINANFYGGKTKHAQRIVKYASNPSISSRLRQEAIAALETWYDATPLDTTTGMPRKNEAIRDDIKGTILKGLKTVFQHAKGELLAQTTRLAKANDYPFGTDELLAQIEDASIASSVRLESLKILAQKAPKVLVQKVDTLLNDKDYQIKTFAMELLLKQDANKGVALMKNWMKDGDLKLKQWTYRQLGQHEAGKNKLLASFDHLRAKKVPADLHLDILEGMRKSPFEEVKKEVQAYDAKLMSEKPLVKHASLLEGGDIARGKNIFLTHGVSQCVRCHKVNGFGADVGPDLSTIGKDKSRSYLLEAIVAPNADVAPGYGMMTISLKNGETLSGLWMKDDKKGITLKMADGKSKLYPHDKIASKVDPVSGMPPMELLLKPDEIRDLVAYMSSLKKAAKGSKKKNSH